MFGRPRKSLHELIRSQHEESRRYLEEHDNESRRYWEVRDEEWKRYGEKRDAEVQAFVNEVQAHKAELHELREKAEAREEETREFNREILLRNEKVYTSLIAEMEEGRKQIQANTKAVLSVLDRFNGSDGLAA
ncbi:MAG TPA: hypothetical protein VGN84_11970 [Solirubrobacterales bacterium]|jgi:hypothetical protein|nr:hypothetical protein [Solirubrobacterales bacterium]